MAGAAAAAAPCVDLVPSITQSPRRGRARDTCYTFRLSDFSTAKKNPTSVVAMSAFGKGKIHPFVSSALVKTSGLRNFTSPFALPLNEAASDLRIAVNPDGGSIKDDTKGPEPKGTLLHQQKYPFHLIPKVVEAGQRLNLAWSRAKKAGKRLKEEEASLEEALTESVAAQAAVKESEIVALWILNTLLARSKYNGDSMNDGKEDCKLVMNAAKEVCEQLELDKCSANEVRARVQSIKVSLMLAKEKSKKTAQDTLKEEEASLEEAEEELEAVQEVVKESEIVALGVLNALVDEDKNTGYFMNAVKEFCKHFMTAAKDVWRDLDFAKFKAKRASKRVRSLKASLKVAKEKKQKKKVAKKESSLEEAEKEYEGAQVAVQEFKIFALWVLNSIVAEGKHDGYFMNATKESYKHFMSAANEAFRQLELAKSNANKASERVQSLKANKNSKTSQDTLEEDQASLEEAKKESKAAQATLKESEIVAEWVLNFLDSEGQDLPNDCCRMAAKKARDDRELAKSIATKASERVQSLKDSLRIAEENYMLHLRRTKSIIESLHAEMSFLRESNLEQMKTSMGGLVDFDLLLDDEF